LPLRSTQPPSGLKFPRTGPRAGFPGEILRRNAVPVPLFLRGQGLSLFDGDRLHSRFIVASGAGLNHFHCVNGEWRRRIHRLRRLL
jgi:hypothetical protein